MMYPYLTYPDYTEVTYSDIQKDGTVKVYIERPNKDGDFDSAECILPDEELKNVKGFSLFDKAFLEEMISDNKNTIMDFAANGGV